MLQFQELSAEHTGCLAAIVEDLSPSETLRAEVDSPSDNYRASRLRRFAAL